MSDSTPGIIHVASSPVGGRQHCRNCGEMLIDRTQENHLQENQLGEQIEIWFETGGIVCRTPDGMFPVRSPVPSQALCIKSREVNPCL